MTGPGPVRDVVPGQRGASDARLTRRELLVHLGTAVSGALVATGLVGMLTLPLAWRSAALASALTVVVRALGLLVVTGRSEWRRERPSVRVYLRIAARFAAAFLLAGVATS